MQLKKKYSGLPVDCNTCWDKNISNLALSREIVKVTCVVQIDVVDGTLDYLYPGNCCLR